MQCETVHAQLADFLSHALTDTESEVIRLHLVGCRACRNDADGFAETWRLLGSIASPPPDSARMRTRLIAIIDGFEHAITSAPAPAPGIRGGLAALFTQSHHHLLRAAFACALVAIGIAIGHYMVPLTDGAESTLGGPDRLRAPRSGESAEAEAKAERTRPTETAAEIVAMRGELRDLREMITLSLMQQQSASNRLKGVSWSGQIDRPSSEVVAALLDTLMHDPNVNVRLATIDALERFASQDIVRRGTIQAVDRQVSPLVQIALIDFMVKANERESIGTLRRLSEDPKVNAAVRARAVWGLQQLG